MLANDVLKRHDKGLLEPSSQSGSFAALLGAAKLIKCVGYYVASDLLHQIHVVQLLFLIKFLSSCVLLPLQSPFQGQRLRKSEWMKIVSLAGFATAIQILQFYGLTLCGPFRSVMISEQSSFVVIAFISTLTGGKGGAAKVRGSICFALGFLSLILLDRDISVAHDHAESHGHHTGLNRLYYHGIKWFGVADHKGGVLILLGALLMAAGYENAFKRVAVEVGGAKRLFALCNALSAAATLPLAFIATFADNSTPGDLSWTQLSLLVLFAAAALVVIDFYGEAAAATRLDARELARWCPIFVFASGFALSRLWFSPYREAIPERISPTELRVETIEHGLSGGAVVTLVFFVIATYALTTAHRPRARAGYFIGWSSAGLPLYAYGEDFLAKTSHSIVAFGRSTLKQVLASTDSRRIFYFLVANLMFCGVEFLYGFWTNSLGLISDGFHMFFDCSALVMGLVASVMSRWAATRLYSYGYGRVEVLSGFINALFLIVIAFFIFLEALERLFDPPDIHTDKLLFVSVAGLVINLFGMFAFHGSHGHSHGGGGHGHSHGASAAAPVAQQAHGHSHDAHGHAHDGADSHHGHSHGADAHGHGHSHGASAAECHDGHEDSHGHGHSHAESAGHAHSAPSHGGGGGHGHSHGGANANMQGVFLHVLADTLGSVAVIVSTLLIENFGWLFVDPLCSLLLAILIFLSVLPLLSDSAVVLLQRTPAELEYEFEMALDKILQLEGVVSYSRAHLWQLKSEIYVASVHVQVTNETNQQRINQLVLNALRDVGATQMAVQVEKDAFFQHVTALCPSYAQPTRISRNPLSQSLMVKSI